MDERFDLTPLELDDVRRELLVAAIMERSAAELSRRAEESSPFQALVGWCRPALAAAALLAVVCLPVLMQPGRVEVAEAAGLTDALAVPAPADAWITAERAPTVGDLLLAMEREAR